MFLQFILFNYKLKKYLMLPNIFKPIYTQDSSLVRIGSLEDGGYILTKELVKNTKHLISFGISDNFDFEKHLKEKKLTLADVTQEIIKEYYGTKNAPIHLIVPINAETSENSRREFQKLVAGESIENEIKCE